MIKSLLFTLLILFAVSGICDFLFLIRKLILAPKSQIKHYTVVFLNENFAIEELKFLWEKMRWYGNDFATTLIAISDNLKTDEIEKCKNFCVGKNIILTTSKENIIQWKTPYLKSMNK